MEFTHDAMGNVLTVTRLAGTAEAVTTTFTYEPTYQQVASVTAPLNHTTTFGYDALGNLTTITDATGRQTTMTYYCRARYYNPKLQRFISEDPIEFLGGDLNLHGYVGGNTLKLVDPRGLDWIYKQSNGQLFHLDNHTGVLTLVGEGDSGYGAGFNNSAMEHVRGMGPIPQGIWTIGPQGTNVTSSGTRLPGSMRLAPGAGTDTFGRDGFIIHGGSFAPPDSSRGCIILAPHVRDQIGGSGDGTLRVVP